MLISGLLLALAALVVLRVRLTRNVGAESDIVSARLGERCEVLVRRCGRYRELVFSGAEEVLQARVLDSDPTRSCLPYTDGFALGFTLSPALRRVLFLGGGACLSPRQFVEADSRVVVDVVEREPVVFDLATRYFRLTQSPRLKMHIVEAADFVEAAPGGSYDMVVNDLYCDERRMRDEFADDEFIRRTKRLLNEDGLLCFNVCGSLEGDKSTPLRRTWLRFVQMFGNESVLLFPVMGESEKRLSPTELRNMLIFARTGGSPLCIDDALGRVRDVSPALFPRLGAIASMGISRWPRIP